MLAKHALSQLSYGPMPGMVLGKLAPAKPKGFARSERDAELMRGAPPKAALNKWWAWEDLNLRPHAYQARALTN